MQSLRNRAKATGAAFSSWQSFTKALEVEQSDGFAETKHFFVWSNHHMDPTPPEERTWRAYNYAALWWAYGFSTGVWSLGSSMISGGLTPGQAIACVFIAHFLGAVAIVINGRFGAVYHIGFPPYARVAWGMYGSFLPILLRCATGIIWVGTNCVQGGYFTSIILRCIFGHKWSNIPNTLPAKAGITTQNLVGLLIFWVLTLPFLFMKVHNTRWLWTIKAVILPPAVIGLFIWTQVVGHHADGSNFATVKHYQGAQLAWVMLKMVNSAMGKTSTSQVNQPDLSRYAISRNAPLWSQLIALPVANTAVSCLGIFATSSLYAKYGTLVWNPWSVCSLCLDHYWSGSVRFAILLVSLAFCLSIFVSNQAANVIPFGADFSALFGRYMDINRGQLLAYILGIVINPWYILASAATFLSFLSGYSLVLGGLVGVSAADYFWRKGNISVPDLYSTKGSMYMYGWGVSWRALAAFFIGIVPTLPGFAASFGDKVGSKTSTTNNLHLFYISWLFATVVSALAYIVICLIVPDKNITAARQDRFEQWADEQKDLLDRTRLPVQNKVIDEKKVDEDGMATVQEVVY